MQKRFATGMAWSLAAALMACGASGSGSGGSTPGASGSDEGGEGEAAPNSVVHQSGGKEVEATFGSPGGVLELASGVKVEIPPGAVDGSQRFVLKEAPMTTAFFNEEHERPWGPTFVVSPGVEAPEGRSVRISVPLASYPQGWGDVAIAYEYPVSSRVGAEDSQHTRWQYENAQHTGGRAVAELPALNGYRLQFVVTNLEAQ
ncbi:MAG: hypothetical protein OEZ06_08200 [Myxococcales bacterium]|nr:hypothetical protein [Myxococcales bacterium]